MSSSKASKGTKRARETETDRDQRIFSRDTIRQAKEVDGLAHKLSKAEAINQERGKRIKELENELKQNRESHAVGDVQAMVKSTMTAILNDEKKYLQVQPAQAPTFTFEMFRELNGKVVAALEEQTKVFKKFASSVSKPQRKNGKTLPSGLMELEDTESDEDKPIKLPKAKKAKITHHKSSDDSKIEIALVPYRPVQFKNKPPKDDEEDIDVEMSAVEDNEEDDDEKGKGAKLPALVEFRTELKQIKNKAMLRGDALSKLEPKQRDEFVADKKPMRSFKLPEGDQSLKDAPKTVPGAKPKGDGKDAKTDEDLTSKRMLGYNWWITVTDLFRALQLPSSNAAGMAQKLLKSDPRLIQFRRLKEGQKQPFCVVSMLGVKLLCEKLFSQHASSDDTVLSDIDEGIKFIRKSLMEPHTEQGDAPQDAFRAWYRKASDEFATAIRAYRAAQEKKKAAKLEGKPDAKAINSNEDVVMTTPPPLERVPAIGASSFASTKAAQESEFLSIDTFRGGPDVQFVGNVPSPLVLPAPALAVLAIPSKPVAASVSTAKPVKSVNKAVKPAKNNEAAAAKSAQKPADIKAAVVEKKRQTAAAMQTAVAMDADDEPKPAVAAKDKKKDKAPKTKGRKSSTPEADSAEFFDLSDKDSSAMQAAVAMEVEEMLDGYTGLDGLPVS